MSAAKTALDNAIFIALEAAATTPATTPEQSTAKLREVATNLSTAIDAYVVLKLEALSAQLKLPSAFVGTSASGPVAIAPASFATYDPKVT